MATIYVNKNGSDANNGSTAALAKVTISAGITAAGSGGTVIVGSGSYNELLTVSASQTLYADGNVVLDGNGQASSQLVSGNNLSFIPYTTGGTWTFKNSPGSIIFNLGTTAPTVTFNFCTFISNSNNTGITYGLNTVNGVITITNCVFIGFSSVAVTSSGGGGLLTFNITKNTFYNCTIALQPSILSQVQISGTITQNIFSTGTTAIQVPSANSSLVNVALNNNDYYGYTNLLKTSTGTYTTLGQVQAINSLEVNGMVTNPAFLDTTNAILYPTVNLNPLMQIGAYAFGKTTGSANAGTDTTWKIINALDSPAQSGTGWYNADTNITQDGTTKDFILNAGTSGIIVSPVYDLGSPQFVSSVNIAATQIWAAAGATNGKMIDTTSTDIRPNYQTIRVRGQTTAFNQGDASPSWVEVKSDNTFTSIVARYFQIECTLRGDDVGA